MFYIITIKRHLRYVYLTMARIMNQEGRSTRGAQDSLFSHVLYLDIPLCGLLGLSRSRKRLVGRSWCQRIMHQAYIGQTSVLSSINDGHLPSRIYYLCNTKFRGSSSPFVYQHVSYEALANQRRPDTMLWMIQPRFPTFKILFPLSIHGCQPSFITDKRPPVKSNHLQPHHPSFLLTASQVTIATSQDFPSLRMIASIHPNHASPICW